MLLSYYMRLFCCSIIASSSKFDVVAEYCVIVLAIYPPLLSINVLTMFSYVAADAITGR